MKLSLNQKITWEKTKRVSFVLFLWSLGLITGIAYHFFYVNWKEITTPRIVEIVNVAHADEIKPVSTVEIKKEDSVDEIADFIWNHESTRGKNNYSKCEEKGLINGVGYNIPGGGKYQCFNNHEDEMKVLIGWIIDKRAKGLSDNNLLCLYSGNNYDICQGKKTI